MKSPDFDACMKRVFNKLRPYFKRGIPELGVAPFDPHFAKEVNQVRSIFGMGYTLTLKEVFERGWSTSTVTKFKTDWENQRIIYSQYFPEKWLEGNYEFKGDLFGLETLRSGRWNMTLRDYSQTTRIKRNGSGVDVHVEVDHIGDMDIHVGNLLSGRSIMEQVLDRIINATWKPGFAVIRPLINDLVSTAFTDIWSKSFKDFPLKSFITE
ncbi:jg26859 [Pararge aegeria aegeria]|uniref:Jg26859 protein n=2 Tax=Pararge aegeria TaxID=116150 RepID=A0A8S4SK80_9NEOP|nr:jg26859 [Pararge aegeria aegeria]